MEATYLRNISVNLLTSIYINLNYFFIKNLRTGFPDLVTQYESTSELSPTKIERTLFL